MRGGDDIEDVINAQQGDDQAFSALFDRWFDRVHDVAFHIVHDPTISAEVTQDVFLNAWQKLDTLQEPAAFGGWLLRSARNRALNRLKYERRSTPMNMEDTMMEVDRRRPGIDASDVQIDLDWQQHLVWAASSALGERDASILSLHLRSGLEAPELADELGVTPNNAHQLLFRLRERLGTAIASWTVWREGSPRCDELRVVLDRAGSSSFDRATAKLVTQHVNWCDICANERDRAVAPQAIFAGVPVLVAPAVLKTRVAAALEQSGVPMSAATIEAAGTPGDRTGPPAATAVTPSPFAADAGEAARSEHRLRRGTLMAVGAAAIILALVFFATRQVDDGTTTDEISVGPTSTTVTTPTTAPSPTTSPATTGAPIPPPVIPPAPPEPSPPPVVDTTPSTADEPSPAPTILAFRAFRSPGPGCATPSEVVRVAWSTTDATEVLVTGPGAPTEGQPPSGSLDLCVAGPGTFQVFATGPGGTTPSAEVSA